MNYSIDALKNMLNEKVDTAPQFTDGGVDDEYVDEFDWLDSYLGYYSSDDSYGYNDY
jgi:hypothetical protein